MQQHAETAGLTLQTELSAEPAVHRRRRVRARPRVSQPDSQRDSGDRPGRARSSSPPRCTAERVQMRDLRHRLRHSRRAPRARSSKTSSRPSVAASGWASRSPRRSSSSSADTSRVASEVGKGTTFVLEFPRTQARPMLVGQLGYTAVGSRVHGRAMGCERSAGEGCEEGAMFRKLVKTSTIRNRRAAATRCSSSSRKRCAALRRFNCEVVLGATDRIIVDGDSHDAAWSRGWRGSRRRRSTAGCSAARAACQGAEGCSRC